MSAPTDLRVAHLASEVVPFSKTGGLADVVGALPAAQAELGARVTIVAPAHRPQLAEPPAGARSGELTVMGLRATLYRGKHRGCEVVLIDCPPLFARPSPYGLNDGDYPDNPIRFAFFVRAALAALGSSGGTDIVHAHDWQAALAPLLLREDDSLPPEIAAAQSVLTVHNLAYQGLFGPWAMAACELPARLFHPGCLEFYGQVNFLKGGLVAAGAITTVSPTYASEILTPDFGCRLEGVLADRRSSLVGIVNGLDLAAWDPASDRHLPVTYNASSAAAGKAAARKALAAEAALLPGERPLAGMVSRLAEQKGADLLAAAVEEIVAQGFDLVVLGTGDRKYEELLQAAELAHPGRVKLFLRFDEGLAHRIYAGSDLFLMPSRYEPCGLGQMIAMRYGTLPVVHRTGGLADTVTDAASACGTGFVFAELTPAALVAALARARETLRHPRRLAELRRHGMGRDFSWAASAREYLELYDRLVG
ncbi:MAG: glycogen synthase GlgA [Acidobacteriota bacterium]